MNRLVVPALLVIALTATIARAEPYPESVDPYINDFADVIDTETELSTRAALASLQAETGIEMTVVTIRSRSDFDPSPSLESFALGLFNGWGVGDAVNNDGILVLVVKEDRETRIQLGSAYDQGYDVIAQDIISTSMVPEFREGRFAEGIESGAIEIIDRIALTLATTSPHQGAGDAPAGLFDRLDGWLFGALFVGIAAWGIFGRRAGNALVRLRRCPGCGRRGLHRQRVTLAGPDGIPGPQRVRTACRYCDYHDDRDAPAARRARGAERRGGFGGGRSSGGGASGR